MKRRRGNGSWKEGVRKGKIRIYWEGKMESGKKMDVKEEEDKTRKWQ